MQICKQRFICIAETKLFRDWYCVNIQSLILILILQLNGLNVHTNANECYTYKLKTFYENEIYKKYSSINIINMQHVTCYNKEYENCFHRRCNYFNAALK